MWLSFTPFEHEQQKVKAEKLESHTLKSITNLKRGMPHSCMSGSIINVLNDVQIPIPQLVLLRIKIKSMD